jgi:hypothetical protein
MLDSLVEAAKLHASKAHIPENNGFRIFFAEMPGHFEGLLGGGERVQRLASLAVHGRQVGQYPQFSSLVTDLTEQGKRLLVGVACFFEALPIRIRAAADRQAVR